MSKFKRGPVPGGKINQAIISSLKATKMIEKKPVFSAELIAVILDLLPVPDIMNFSRTSKKMLEMVYDDSRWVQRLKAMGVWNEEDAIKKKTEIVPLKHEEEAERLGIGVIKTKDANLDKPGIFLFDAPINDNRPRTADLLNTQRSYLKRFETLVISNSVSAIVSPLQESMDPGVFLKVLSQVRSIRGCARMEYGKIYAALAPLYNDLARSKNYIDSAIFRVYQNPEEQAQMLAQLQKFIRSDWSQGWKQREEKLMNTIKMFEKATLYEFEYGYDAGDIDGKMRRNAHALTVLNGGQAGIDLFIQKTPNFMNRSILGNPMDCINQAFMEGISFQPFRDFLGKLIETINEQIDVIDRIFPIGKDIVHIFLDKTVHEILGEYISELLNTVHKRNIATYVKAVPEIFEQTICFGANIKPSKASDAEFALSLKAKISSIFLPHLDLYLQEEQKYFKEIAEIKVSEWESKLTEQDATAESFFMSNFNRQADKQDFLTSFKKCVVMPVTLVSPFGAKQTAAQQQSNRASRYSPNLPPASRPQKSSLQDSNNRSLSLLPVAAPTDELAAKAALMASRLEGIRSLFSIEVALDLTHAAKASIDRVALFVQLAGLAGEDARAQCSALFMLLLQVLAEHHIKPGFDKAIDHLSKYNPREVCEHQQVVVPLVTFLELVNVGDLISQMIDVFYEQQLCANKLVDRNDFLDPASEAKKRFEQMLDERVAAGLNKGIDVLMDEVEYLCATVQVPTDYNPVPTADGVFDVGPTKAAELVVNLIQSHTKMLIGSTEKNMLDVFIQEVGLRLFTVLCKHLKRQRISLDGSMKLISDMNVYFTYIKTLKNPDLLEYFKALKELSQIYLIAPVHAKEMAEVIADTSRFGGVFRAEEVYEFVGRRTDWFSVRKDVERAMYGIGCEVM